MTDDPNMIPAADAIADELDGADPEAVYRAKLESVRQGRKLGLSDAELEEALGITLKPEDRSETPA